MTYNGFQIVKAQAVTVGHGQKVAEQREHTSEDAVAADHVPRWLVGQLSLAELVELLHGCQSAPHLHGDIVQSLRKVGGATGIIVRLRQQHKKANTTKMECNTDSNLLTSRLTSMGVQRVLA